ncbi:Alpha/beta hydrolase fold-1 [Phaeosphaeria sp. MPI-PUGE-AT-0046c]|nr:Alpha/beta hydrolase fold-1 [Phaeosphaeria sp. MPI-PUGE-AT-0046c]
MSKPTIVMVPGSFVTPGVYQPIIELLRARGFPALEIFLPSTQKRVGLDPATMQQDADRIRDVAEALIAQNKEVVVVAHSYGGFPATQGLAGMKVKRIVYLAAIAPNLGETYVEALPIIQAAVNASMNGYMHLDPVQTASGIGNDFESWDFAYECAQKLPHHSTVSFTAPTTQIAYDKVPVSYILTERDLVVSPEYQEKYIKNIQDAQGKTIDVVRKPWGHCPNWSRPEELAEVLIAEASR